MMQPRFPRGGCAAAAASTAPNNNPTISRSRLPEAGSVVSGNTAVNKMPISWQPWLPWAGFAAAAERA